MSAAPTRGRWLVTAFGAAVTALAAFGALSVLAPSAASARQDTGPPAEHTVVFGPNVPGESAPRDLLVDSGDIIYFENSTPAPDVTPVHLVIGSAKLTVGASRVAYQATRSVRYEGSYTPLPGPLHTITVAPPAPVPPGPQPSPSPAGNAPPAGSGAPPRGGGATVGSGPGSTASVPSGGALPSLRPGDPGYVPSGAGEQPSAEAGGAVSTNQAPPPAAAARPARQAAGIGSDSTTLPAREGLAVLAALLLLGVGTALARSLIRAWLDTAQPAA